MVNPSEAWPAPGPVTEPREPTEHNEPNEPNEEEPTDATQAAAAGVVGGALVGGGVWGLTGTVVGALGFGANGIAAGSTAASMMSAAAVANGGGVAAGSTVAVLQSIGAVGLATPVGLGIVGAGAVVGGTIIGLKAYFSKPKSDVGGEDASSNNKGKGARPDEEGEDTCSEVEGEDASPGLGEVSTETEQKGEDAASGGLSWILSECPSESRDPVQTRFAHASWFVFECTSATRGPVLIRFELEAVAREVFKNSSATEKKVFAADITPAGGSVLEMKGNGSKSESDLDRPSWFLFQWTSATQDPVLTRFVTEGVACEAFKSSSAPKKAVFSAHYMA